MEFKNDCVSLEGADQVKHNYKSFIPPDNHRFWFAEVPDSSSGKIKASKLLEIKSYDNMLQFNDSKVYLTPNQRFTIKTIKEEVNYKIWIGFPDIKVSMLIIHGEHVPLVEQDKIIEFIQRALMSAPSYESPTLKEIRTELTQLNGRLTDIFHFMLSKDSFNKFQKDL